ncbi:MAG TPA: MgtC/SapB family protein [Caulobacteraceae bacterium]|nr:MgtC/SapB family protein [Caulobacteraceae bacterium]
MFAQLPEIALDLALAWLAGSLIGLERSHNGRAAGFRTHAIVALAAAASMIVTFEPQIVPAAVLGGARLDPGRIAQGVMTGVGFIGAGVIFKEGVSVQGLTTAACIWATSAIGLLFGLSLYAAGVLVTAAVLVSLTVFRWLENILPENTYAIATFRFAVAEAPTEEGLRDLLDRSRVTLTDASFALRDGGLVEFHGTLKTTEAHGLGRLAERLRTTKGLAEFHLARVSK